MVPAPSFSPLPGRPPHQPPLLCGAYYLRHLAFIIRRLFSTLFTSSALLTEVSKDKNKSSPRVSNNSINDITTKSLPSTKNSLSGCFIHFISFKFYSGRQEGIIINTLYVRKLRREKLRNLPKLTQQSASTQPDNFFILGVQGREDCGEGIKQWASLSWPTARMYQEDETPAWQCNDTDVQRERTHTQPQSKSIKETQPGWYLGPESPFRFFPSPLSAVLSSSISFFPISPPPIKYDFMHLCGKHLQAPSIKEEGPSGHSEARSAWQTIPARSLWGRLADALEVIPRERMSQNRVCRLHFQDGNCICVFEKKGKLKRP